MTMRRAWFNRLLWGNRFGLSKFKFEIDEGLPERQSLKDIAKGKKLDAKKNAKAFKMRVKDQKTLRPIPMRVDKDKDGNLSLEGKPLEYSGIEVKGSAKKDTELMVSSYGWSRTNPSARPTTEIGENS